MEVIKTPQPINRLERIYYDPKRDAMYLVGYTRENPHHDGVWKIMGREIVRYDGWSTGNRIPSWRVVPDYIKDGSGNGKPASVAIAEDYLFVCYVFEEVVDIFSTESGEYVGQLSHTKALGDCGWVDIPEGIDAFKRSNGEYIIFVEEDAKAKVIMYQWRPEATGVGSRTDAPRDFDLLPVSPNPFNPSTQIKLTLPTAADVRVTVYNALGQKVRTLLNGRRDAGVHTLSWRGQNDADLPVAVGVYLIRMEAGEQVFLQKALLVK